ncbi:MAG: DUF1804 family protein [Magnetococcales bacterium]|nr:DUF1804 family protein [Magnetococcales bacterium]
MKNNTCVENVADEIRSSGSGETMRHAVRMAYRDNGGNLAKAAREHGIAESTARRWRAGDREQGVDWEVNPSSGPWDQAAACLVGNRRERLVSALLEDYLGLHKEAVEAVKGGEVKPLERVEALSRLSQALDRTLRALGKASPELSRLAVARWVLERQAEFVRLRYPEHLGVLVEILEPFGAELVREMDKG